MDTTQRCVTTHDPLDGHLLDTAALRAPVIDEPRTMKCDQRPLTPIRQNQHAAVAQTGDTILVLTSGQALAGANSWWEDAGTVIAAQGEKAARLGGGFSTRTHE